MGWLRWQRAVRGYYMGLLRRFDTRHELPIWPGLLLLRLELPPSFTHKQCSLANARDQRRGHRHTCSGLTEAVGVPSWLRWQRAVRGHYVALLRRFDTRHGLPIWSGLLLLCVELQTPVGRDRGRSHRVACGDELCAGLKHAEVSVFFFASVLVLADTSIFRDIRPCALLATSRTFVAAWNAFYQLSSSHLRSAYSKALA